MFQIITGVILILLGILIFPIHADQEFIHLTPSEGSSFLVPLTSDKVFDQTFQVQGQTISKLGTYFIPLSPLAKTSMGLVRIALLQDGQEKAFGAIPVSLLDTEGASLIRVTPPVATKAGEDITMRITIAPEASRFVAMQQREFDESFPDRGISFTVNGVKQKLPLGYSVFETTWSPFVQQLGGLLVLTGLLLLTWRIAMKMQLVTSLLLLIGVAVLYAIPSFSYSMIFLPLVVLLLISYWALLRVFGRSILASFFGACLFACSTWLPLALITGGSAHDILPLRDALIDPNQISVSHGAGGYIGIAGAIFAVIGILIWLSMVMRKRFTPSHAETAMLVLLCMSMIITFLPGPMQTSRGIIVVVFCLSWFASLAFDSIQRFIGTRDTVAQTLMVILFCISLLDLMHITSQTFAYGLGG